MGSGPKHFPGNVLKSAHASMLPFVKHRLGVICSLIGYNPGKQSILELPRLLKKKSILWLKCHSSLQSFYLFILKI